MSPLRRLASILLFAVLLAGLAALGGCSGSGKSKAKKRTVLMTTYDDARVGQEVSKQVAAEMGLLEDPELTEYVSDIGNKLLRGIPRQGFDYQFSVVDMVEPNAFALPGGYIFVSRGLLALANDEDELACVIGHEITHAAHRHSAAQQALAKRGNPLAMPWNRAARMAGYSRDMERDADEGGQILCAAAGYDPMGMSTFLKSLGLAQRQIIGYARAPSFFDSHPGSTERAASNAVRAREMRWQRDPEVGDPRESLLRHVDGVDVGQRPQAGIFRGDVFIHPDLDFQLRFPDGWRKSNSNRAVGATSPRGDAVVFLTADIPPGELESQANLWIERQRDEGARLEIVDSKPVKVGHIDALRMEVKASTAGGKLTAYVTFIPYGQSIWRVTGVSRARDANRFLGRTLSTSRSFRPLSEEERMSVKSARLRVAIAEPGEDIQALSRRTGNAWTVGDTALYNGIFVDHEFSGGETVKIARLEPYVPKTKEPATP